MSVQPPGEYRNEEKWSLLKSEILTCHPDKPHFCRMTLIIALSILFIIQGASAAEMVLNSSSIGQYSHGIKNSGTDTLIIEINDNVTIASNSSAGIESAGPVTIRSLSGKALDIVVNSENKTLYGIRAPSVSIESGTITITAKGKNNENGGSAYGICAESGNVTISGGSVSTTVETRCHKNKGIYASKFIIVSDGIVHTVEQGGSNTFGLDGGEVDAENKDGGVIVSGGTITVSSGGASERNIGIDSKFGTVNISGNPVIFILEDGSGSSQNYAYNANITTFSGDNAVMFTSAGGNYSLRKNAVLSRNATLIPGAPFEIPAGLNFSIAQRTYLTKPADTTFLYGGDQGTFVYDRSIACPDGSVIFAGTEQKPQVSAPVAGLLLGLCMAIILVRRK
jgi:hypothetical protein